MKYQEHADFPCVQCNGCVFFDESEDGEDKFCDLIEWVLKPECKFSFDQIKSVMKCNKEDKSAVNTLTPDQIRAAFDRLDETIRRRGLRFDVGPGERAGVCGGEFQLLDYNHVGDIYFLHRYSRETVTLTSDGWLILTGFSAFLFTKLMSSC